VSTTTAPDIDPLALRADDFPAFFTARFERLCGHRATL